MATRNPLLTKNDVELTPSCPRCVISSASFLDRIKESTSNVAYGWNAKLIDFGCGWLLLDSAVGKFLSSC
jgi:hypothetical protein